VKLPPRAAVYQLRGDHQVIGLAGGGHCAESIGANGGFVTVGRSVVAQLVYPWQASRSGRATQVCDYFPNSPGAAAVRAEGGECVSHLTAAKKTLPTGTRSLSAMLVAETPAVPGTDAVEPPWVQATLTVLKDGQTYPLNCIMPWSVKDICTSALTYWLIQHAEGARLSESTLTSLAAQISAFVDASRRG
jgi:hypothetical protein